MVNNSSRYPAVTQDRLEQFLRDLANLQTVVRNQAGIPRENYEGAQHFLRMNRQFLPPGFPRDSQMARIGDEIHALVAAAGARMLDRTDEDRERESMTHLFDLGKRLRAAWDEPDQRKRDWLIIALQLRFHEGLNPNAAREQLPEPTLFDRAMEHFREVSRQARVKHCANPDCPTPYFIAAKRSYKYCDPDCAVPAQKQFKREWWTKNGPGWRKRREAKNKRKGGAR